MPIKNEKHLNTFKKLRTLFVKNKIRLQRTLSYLAILNSGMILFLVLSDVEKYGIDIDIAKWYFPIYALTLIIFLIVGWIDDYAGLHREEARVQTNKNPQITLLVDTITRLEGKIDKMDKDVKKLQLTKSKK